MARAHVGPWHQHSQPETADEGRASRVARIILGWFALTALYVAAAKLGLAFAFVQKNASPVWPPSGIALAAMLLFGVRAWPAICAGAVIVNFGTGVPLEAALSIGVGNTLAAITGLTLLQRVHFDRAILRLRDAVALAATSVVASMVSATIGAASLLASGEIVAGLFTRIWTIWWLGDSLGVLLVVPVILGWHHGLDARVRARRTVLGEAAVLAFVVSLVVFFTFTQEVPIAYTVFPILLWTAFRFGLPGAATTSLLIASVAVWATSRGGGPFGRVSDGLLYSQAFSGVVAITALVVSAVDAERMRLATERGALAEAARVRGRLELLDRTTDVLIDQALEPNAIFGAISRATLPALADWFVADMVGEDGEVRRVAVRHGDPAKQAVADELRRSFPPGDGDLLSSAHVIDRGETSLSVGLPDRASPRERALLQAMGVRSIVTVPMIAHGRTLGALTFASMAEYGEDDVVLARVVGHRAALMLDNARLLDRARRAVRLRDEILGVVAHDLRAPLSVVLLRTEMLLRGPVDDLATSIGAIGAAALRMQRLIEDLLDVVSIEAGSLSLRRQVQELTPTIEEAVLHARTRAAEKSIQLVSRIEALPPVACDQQRIQQVLSNLIDNAIKYTAEGGTISLMARVADDEIEIVVSDTGCGIPEDQLTRVFDRYWRAPGAGVRGAGLGLSIARGIVEAHGGRMTCTSRVGKGTAFVFTLPVFAR